MTDYFAPAVLAAALTLLCPTPAKADFTWLAPTWTANPFDVIGGPSAMAQPTFGPVNADLANSGGSISAGSDPDTANSGGFVMVTFSRTFVLFNDPYQSEVTLFGTLSGALNSSSAAAILAENSVLASAEITSVPDGGAFNFITAVDSSLAANSTDSKAVLTPTENTLDLPDGTYTVSGSLLITLSVEQAAVGIADSNADVNWVVGLTATKIVPEPSTCLLLGAEAAWLLAWAVRRRMRN